MRVSVASIWFQDEAVHPAIMRLGLKFVDGTIDGLSGCTVHQLRALRIVVYLHHQRLRVTGVNARTLAMLAAFRHYIRDFTAPGDVLPVLRVGREGCMLLNSVAR